MIGRITGTLIEKTPPIVCVDVGGVGYEIDVPMSTLYDLPDNGATITLYTHLAVREDAHTLYGFLSSKERSAFRALIKVTGIGARTALAVLSGMSVDELANAITHQETGLQIGRAHVCTPVTNAHLICRLLHEKKHQNITTLLLTP